MPDLGRMSGGAKQHINRRARLLLVGEEVEIVSCELPMNPRDGRWSCFEFDVARDAESAENLGRRNATEHAAFATGALGPNHAIQITPEVARDFGDVGIASGIVLPARRTLRRHAENGSARASEIANFAQDFDRQMSRSR